MRTTVESPWMSARAAASYAHVSPNRIYEAINNGELRASKLPDSNVRRIHAADIDDWLRGYTFVPTFK